MPAQIFYFTLTDEMRKEEKLKWFENTAFQDIPFEMITPDEKGNWINQTDNDFESLIPMCSKETKLGNGGNAIFELFSLGVSTNRDEWVYDFSKENLKNKIQFFINTYNAELEKANLPQVAEKQEAYGGKEREDWNESIKWSEYLKGVFKRKKRISFDEKLIVRAGYRPFVKQFYYAERLLSDRLTQNHYDIFGRELDRENYSICFSGLASNKGFQVLGIKSIWSLDFLEKTNCLPLYRYENGERKDNITDWALALFEERYSTSLRSGISKQDIFHYVYAVLHNPKYRAKYEQNLKRDFPRIPLYEDFWKWAGWGGALMDLHLNYETIESYELEVVSYELKNAGAAPKAKLKANKELGEIYIDEATTLKGVPPMAWEYKLGNRSALEWILDQYKESKPSDPTIAEKFNTYKFADYKTQVVDLLQKVCTVSVRTMQIIEEMQKL